MRRLLLEAQRALRAPSRNARMAVVVGRLLGGAFVLCFVTGLYSYFLQQPLPWMRFPTHPYFLYQLTQGLHITSGIACIPLLLGKVYTVFPKLFQHPPIRGVPHLLERASITLFVSSSVVELTIGLLDTYQWYPFPFYFKQVHFALAWVIVGSLAIHIAVKLPTISRHWTRRRSLAADDAECGTEAGPAPARTAVGDAEDAGSSATVDLPAASPAFRGVTGRVIAWIDAEPAREPRLNRRGFLGAVLGSTVAVVALTAGQSFSFLDPLNVFAPRKKGLGPAGVPVNRTASAAQVLETATADDWTLTVRRGASSASFSRAELLAMPQAEEVLPIACVEGWSQLAHWSGVRLGELMTRVGRRVDEGLQVTSLEKEGGYRITSMGPEYVEDDRTLVALKLNGETLDLDHGYPARLIAPGRPGVLQTKWLDTIEVL